MTQVVHVDRREAVTQVTLNRPSKLNALSSDLVEALIEVVDQAAHDATRLLVLKGEGKGFSAGFDLSGLAELSDGDLFIRLVRIETLLQKVYHAPYATLSLAHGHCYGAGADLACACVRRVAVANTKLRMPGLRFGVVLGTARLSNLIGADRARNILGATKQFDATQGLELGVLTGLSDIEEWDNVIESTFADLCTLPQQATSALLAL